MEQRLHDGHRDRVKQRFLREGLDNFEPHQVLEMLLFFGIPRKDTNELAHRLISQFGKFSRVLDAPFEELVKVEGVTVNAAVLLNLCGQMLQVYSKDKYEAGVLLRTTDETGQFLLPYFMNKKNEAVALVCLDNRCKLINCSVVFDGSVNSTEINIRLILQQALLHNATAVVLAHNHPSGHALPSRDDVKSTMDIAKALSVADVRLLDHIVVADNDFVSMRDTPAFAPVFHFDWSKQDNVGPLADESFLFLEKQYNS